MFRSAATKIAHNTTLPSLGGNADLRSLQELITLEKTVIVSLQKLSSDYSKAADAMKAWGQNEGEDLGNILGASANLLAQFSSALSQYASHGHVIRESLKSIRSREENLDDLKRRRRAVHRKADDADKKLSKMGPEHKNLASQMELLNRLKEEIRNLDSEIMTEEASLGDYKRSCTRTWAGLKFGGLLECCEKGIIIGEYGKLLISEIPEDYTQPGVPRSLFYGHSRVENSMNEALRCIGQVSLSSQPPPGTKPIPGFNPPQMPSNFAPNVNPVVPNLPQIHSEEPSFDTPRPSAFSTNTLPNPRRGSLMGQPSNGVDDFGMPISRSPPAISTPFDAPTAGGRFATFPVKQRQDSLPTIAAPLARSGPTGPPSINTQHELGSSFSAEIAEALDAQGDSITDKDASHSWRGRLSGEANLPPPAPVAHGPGPKAVHFEDNSWEDSPSTYHEIPTTPQGQTKHQPHRSEEGSAILAYMTSNDAELPDSPESGGKVPLPSTVDVDGTEPHSPRDGEPPTVGSSLTVSAQSQTSSNLSPESANTNAASHSRIKSMNAEIVDEPGDANEPVAEQEPTTSHRVPPPTFISEEEEERAKNIAALKGVSLELKDFSLPTLSLPGSPITKASESETQSRSNTVDEPAPASPPTQEREPSPLAPPSAPFTREIVSPQPLSEASVSRTPAQAYADSHQSGPSPLSASTQSPTAAQSYAQSYQAQSQFNASPTEISAEEQYPNPYESSPEPASPPLTQSNVPPRLQSLQTQSFGDPGIPPRFQAMRQNSSLHERELPPRFQSPGASAQSTPYRTPNEYPNPGGPLNGSYGAAPSAISQLPPLAPVNPPFVQAVRAPPSPVLSTGTGKISAAAFKRPSPLPGRPGLESSATSPTGSFGSGLPMHPAQNRSYSPSPQQPRQPSPAQTYQQASSSPPQQQHSAYSPPQSQIRQQSLPYPQSLPQQPQYNQSHLQQLTQQVGRPQSRELPPPPAGAARPASSVSDDFGYDYISAYQDGSPVRSEFSDPSQRNSGQQQYAVQDQYGTGSGYQRQQQQPPPSLQVGHVAPSGYGGYGQLQGQTYLPPGAAPSQAPAYGSRYGQDNGLR